MTAVTIPPRKKDFLGCLFFVLFWIIPVMCIGITNKDLPLAPRTFSYMTRISFLFTRGSAQWMNFYMQGLSENSQDWITLPEAEYFRLQPFGYRTRLHQLLSSGTHYARGYKAWFTKQRERHDELARWIAKRYSSNHPDLSPLRAVRLVRGIYKTNEEESKKGRWQKPALESLDKKQVQILFTLSLK